MKVTFSGIHEATPGAAWAGMFARAWSPYKRWFLKEGATRRPDYATCRLALQKHMPELIPTWERLVQLAGGGELEARFLSLYRPTPYLSGCSQAVWTGGDQSLLLRNYDFHPRYFEGTILMSAWNGVKTIVQTDCLWGALDGMNEFGLTVSLTFGGRPDVGDGFGIPLVLRYILEMCRTTAQAKAVLTRIPSHMSYNVSVLDEDGEWLTAHMTPGSTTHFDPSPVTTNHQHGTQWKPYAQAVSSEERWHFLTSHMADPAESAQQFANRFLEPPIFSDNYAASFGTLYTAIYNPRERTIDYVWKNGVWRQSFDNFEEGTRTIHYVQPAVA